jgi:hypothetical protein
VHLRRRIVVWLAWYAVLNVVWLLLVATFNWQEEIVGVVAAAIAATTAEALHEQGLVRARVTLNALAGMGGIPWRVVTETCIVFAALWRQLVHGKAIGGSFHCLLFPATGDRAEDEARRALYKIGASVAPNSYVVGYDEETGSMLVHELVPRRGPVPK